MKAIIEIRCIWCRLKLEWLEVDTADMPEELQKKLNHIILKHREDCVYYGRKQNQTAPRT